MDEFGETFHSQVTTRVGSTIPTPSKCLIKCSLDAITLILMNAFSFNQQNFKDDKHDFGVDQMSDSLFGGEEIHLAGSDCPPIPKVFNLGRYQGRKATFSSN